MAYTKKTTTTEAQSVEQKITNLFIEGLKNKIVGWQKPWVIAKVGNIAYGSEYTGYNKMWASLHSYMYNVQNNYATVAGAALKLGYKFCTKTKRYIDKNGNPVPNAIKTGAKGLHLTRVVQIPLKDKDGKKVLDSVGKEKTFPAITGFCVYSIDHLVWDLSEFVVGQNNNPILLNGEAIVSGYKGCPQIMDSEKAAYSPAYDRLLMPKMSCFESSEAYYRVLFHELVHSTGHFQKLDRAGVSNFDTFGSHQYSFEELVAEIGSGMLCEIAGINMDIENSNAYVNGWIAKLGSEPKWIYKAVAEAKKAVEFILGRPLNQNNPEEELDNEDPQTAEA